MNLQSLRKSTENLAFLPVSKARTAKWNIFRQCMYILYIVYLIDIFLLFTTISFYMKYYNFKMTITHLVNKLIYIDKLYEAVDIAYRFCR